MCDAIYINVPEIMWFMARLQSSSTTSKLKKSILDSYTTLVSDGSHFPVSSIGSCDWVISTLGGGE